MNLILYFIVMAAAMLGLSRVLPGFQVSGWGPALIWILAGSILIGGVHDFAALVASIRHKARSIAEVVHAIAHDKRQVLPVSTVQQGAYGLRGVAISGTAIGNNFSHPKGPKRDAEVALTKQWIDRAAALVVATVVVATARRLVARPPHTPTTATLHTAAPVVAAAATRPPSPPAIPGRDGAGGSAKEEKGR